MTFPQGVQDIVHDYWSREKQIRELCKLSKSVDDKFPDDRPQQGYTLHDAYQQGYTFNDLAYVCSHVYLMKELRWWARRTRVNRPCINKHRNNRMPCCICE